MTYGGTARNEPGPDGLTFLLESARFTPGAAP
jgi:hypothetical protein